MSTSSSRTLRVLDGLAYAVQAGAKAKGPAPITAETEAEKPTRKPPARKGAAAVEEPEAEEVEEVEEVEEPEGVAETEAEIEAEEEEPEAVEVEAGAESEAAAPAKKKTRRGSRGGRNRKKKPTIHVPGDDIGRPGDQEPETERAEPVAEPVAAEEAPEPEPALETEPVSVNGDEPAAPPKKKTRRGSRGGKNRRKRVAREDGPVGAESPNGDAPVAVEEPVPVAEEEAPPAEYVPMSEWLDDFEMGP